MKGAVRVIDTDTLTQRSAPPDSFRKAAFKSEGTGDIRIVPTNPDITRLRAKTQGHQNRRFH